jgi:glycosyltransferase involved in cell wall biosynthesis
MELWPAADAEAFVPGPVNHRMRARLGIPADRTVLVYTGNVHLANAREVRSVYLAVAILNREGHPAILVRAGRDFCPFLGPDETWGRAHSMELGYVPHLEIPELLSVADILVQPGKPGAFNSYRFPSKLPEALAAGRPVVLPACNVGLRMAHGQDAFVLPNVDALGIVDAALSITADRDLYARLASGARTFFERHMNWEKSGQALLAFYRESSTAASA